MNSKFLKSKMELMVHTGSLEKHNLSLVQQDIFYDQLHNIDSPKYNIGGYVNLGSIDETRLRQAHALVVLANRMFGMNLVNQTDGVFVYLGANINTDLPIIDFSASVNPELAAFQWIENAFGQAFNLYGESLYRVVLLKLSSQRYFYVAISHHLLIDGWGVANWAKQLGDYYSNNSQETESKDEFTVYYTQDLTYLQSRRYLKDQTFWKSYLREPVKLLSPFRVLPEQSKCSKRLCFDIDVELFEQVLSSSEVLKQNEHSLFCALIALYFSRITESNTITIGVPAHNRRGSSQKKFIGLYASVSPVKIEIQDSWSFVTLVEMIKAEQVKVFRHQKYPIGHMVRDLGPAARVGLFDVGVNYLKLENKFAYGDSFAQIRYVENEYQTTPFNVTVWDDGNHQPLQLQIDFSLEYFNVNDVQLIGARLLHLLKQVSQNPHVLIGDLDVVTIVEASIIKPELPATVLPSKAPFINLFEQQAALQPDYLALSCLSQNFTYQELNQLAGLLSLQLAEHGVGAGHVVGLLVGRRAEMVIAILALHKLGAAYLPLDPSYPPARLHFMLEDSRCKLLLTTSDLLTLSVNLSLSTLLLDESAKLISSEQTSTLKQLPAYSQMASAGQLAYVIYTSGSTGKPKGVMISQLALSNFLQSMACEPGFGVRDCLLAVTPFSFDISILELLLPLMSGGSVRLFHTTLAQDLNGLIRDLHEYPITMLQMTPSAWKMLLAAGWQGKSNLRALSGGEALPAYLAESLTPKVMQLWNMYGPTETTIWSSCVQVLLPIEFNSIGKPIANTQMLVLDSKNRLLPIGVFGMLYIGGMGLAEGYWDRPELTSERFITLFGVRWYQTGDVARLLPNGEFEFQGRSDHQVKLNGYRIELGEIETLLSRYPGVTNSAVLIKTLASGRQVLCAYVQSQPSVTKEELREALATDLPSFMLPSFFINIPVFPQTPGGKTDLKALPDPECVVAYEHTGKGHFHDSLTSKLLALVKTHLNISRLEPSDNFFDVGASSVDIMEMSVSLSCELGQPLTVVDLFAHPSVRALVKYMQGGLPESQSAEKAKRQDAAQRGKSRLNNRLAARKLLDEA